ncbi:MAG: hypothetical protein ACI9O2_000116 [Flammeovirgaceae bacterium]|jgi:hypothetical protein
MTTQFTNLRFICLLGALLTCSSIAFGQTPERELGYPVPTGGQINAIAVDEENQHLFIGGDFDKLMEGRAFSGLLDSTEKSIVNDYPFFNGLVSTSTPDGNGGISLAGDIRIGSVESVIKISQETAQVDTQFDLELETSFAGVVG